MMNKKYFLAVVALLICFASKAWAYDFSAKCESGQTLYYNITSDDEPYTVEITRPNNSTYESYSGYPEPAGSLTIPSSVTYNGKTYSVTSIGEWALSLCSGLEKVKISSSIISIGSNAFANCSKLKSVTIPNSVTSFGEDAFSHCDKLDALYFTGTLAQWYGKDFNSANENPLRYAHNLYIGNSHVTDMTVPGTITEIKGYLFAGASFKSVTIPKSVTKIGDDAFYDSKIVTIYYKGDIEQWCKITFNTCGSQLFSYSTDNLYINNTNVTNLVIPNTITEIKAHAFAGAYFLKSVTIPESVTSIGKYAFAHCDSHKSVKIPKAVTKINNGVFYSCVGLMSVTLGDSVTIIGDEAFGVCCNLKAIEIPNSVTRIGKAAFACCSNLTSIILPNSVKIIGKEAFFHCYNLTSVTFNNTLTNIGNEAFGGCEKLNTDSVNKIKRINPHAFDNSYKFK